MLFLCNNIFPSNIVNNNSLSEAETILHKIIRDIANCIHHICPHKFSDAAHTCVSFLRQVRGDVSNEGTHKLGPMASAFLS
jgi:hypothetical protein